MFNKKTAYTWSIVSVAATCYTIDGYDNAVFNALQGSAAWMEWAGQPSPTMLGNLHTVSTIAAIFGGFVCAGPLSKYAGRRLPMLISALLVIGATMLQFLMPRHKLVFYFAGRILTCFAQGIVVPIAPTYIAEIAPTRSRGKMMMLWQMNCSIGQFSCFAMSTMTARHREQLPPQWDWRIVVLQQVMGPVILLLFVPFIPESPRWLIQKERIEAARTVLRKCRDNDQEVEEEISRIQLSIEKAKLHKISGAYTPLWTDKSLRRRFLISCGLFAGQQMCGQGSLNNYSTMVYKKVFSDPAFIQLINAISAMIAIISSFWMLLSDRVGRRPMILTGSLGMSLLMICAATLHVASPTLPNGTKPHNIGIGIVTTFFLFVMHYKPTWGATTWLIASEMFSINVRPHAVGMSSQSQNVLNVVIGQVFPMIFSRIQFHIFYIFGGLAAVMFITAFFVLPETKGLSLEEMGIAFGGIDTQTFYDYDEASSLEGVGEKKAPGETGVALPELSLGESHDARLDMTHDIYAILGSKQDIETGRRSDSHDDDLSVGTAI